jgi:large subunit ribosomal protein L21
MYAIVEIAGQQFKVEKGKKIYVHHLEAETGKTIDFDKVLLIDDDGKITIGEPVIKDAVIEGKLIDQVKGDKVIVFKKKRRKGYKVTKGHRQNFTQVEILSINEKRPSGKVQEKEKKETVPAAAEATKAKKSTARKQPAAKKSVTKKETAPAKKQVTKKTSTTKKPAAKKPAAKKPAAKKTAVKKPTEKKTTEKKTTKGKTSK